MARSEVAYLTEAPTAGSTCARIVINCTTGAIYIRDCNGNWVLAGVGGTGVVTDGDYCDITITNGGTCYTIDTGVVTYAKMQAVSATNRLLGRISPGAGIIEELTAAQVKTLLGIGNSFQTVTVQGEGTVVADSGTDTLTIIPGAGIQITVNPGSDEIEISATGTGADRKADTDTLVFAANLAVDYDAGSYDNKLTVLTANLSSPTFTATRRGFYIFSVTQAGLGNFTVTWPANVVFKGAVEQPDATPTKTSSFMMYFDGAEFITSRI
jgi:hypothetical protein